uniref:Uncharacterized protein n=1 Tax=Panagrolaimus superbus TaxID=310955 RepID=A0A914Y5F0_9BILA
MMTSISEIQSQTKPSGVYLLTFDDNKNISFFGKCKLRINLLSKYLTVEPIDESIKMISVSFDQLMIKQKNILSICSTVSDCALFFKDKLICKKVFNAIQREKTQICKFLENEMTDIFYQQFFIPIIKESKKNSDLKEIVKNFMESLKTTQIQGILRILKENNLDEYSSWNYLVKETVDYKTRKNNGKSIDPLLNKFSAENFNNMRNLRKRKFIQCQNLEMGNNSDDREKILKKKPNRNFAYRKFMPSTIIKKTNFKLEHFEKIDFGIQNLVVYVSNDSKLCYNYNRKAKNYYLCRECLKLKQNVAAKFITDKNDENFLQLSEVQHICKPKLEEQIFTSTEYKLQNDGKKLLIFASNDQTLCYEYFLWVKNIYICRGCCKLNFFYCHVKIFNDGEGGENYIKLCHVKHLCQPIKYESKEKETIVKLPNFKIEKFGDLCKTLVIYDPKNQNLCYNFVLSQKKDIFECCKCRYMKTYVIARLLHEEENGEPYVELNLLNHICKPHPEEKIFHNIQVQCNGRKVVIPLEDDPKLCHEYVLQKGNTYRCRECCRLQIHSNIWLFGNKIDGYYAKIIDEKHACKPIKYQLTEKKTIIKMPFYKVETFYKNGIENKSLVVYDFENPALCYNYSYMNSKKHFRCSKCHNLKAFVTANIRKDKKSGEEFVEISLNDHICKLLPEEKILSPSEFHVEKNAKKENDDPKLFIFVSDNKNLCYEFQCGKGNIYRCRMCRMTSGSRQAKLFQKEKAANITLKLMKENIFVNLY